MTRQWTTSTLIGRFTIRASDGHFIVSFEDELLGTYLSPEAALRELIAGATNLPSNGVKTSDLGFPDELDNWDFCDDRLIDIPVSG